MAKGKKTGGRDIPKGSTLNPGGVSKEKREFLDRLRDAEGDAERVYVAFMRLVREGNPPAVLRAVEYIAGKPKELVEVTGKDGKPIESKAEVKHVVVDEGRITRILSVLQRSGALRARQADNTEDDEVHPGGADTPSGGVPPA